MKRLTGLSTYSRSHAILYLVPTRDRGQLYFRD